ncbi:carboxylating nicotinate-nucleotide diphosphorylase [Alkalicaulis satelles]|uniref:Probable nicotinate-nucleotide pyrophosphorylase [carboxylating] n=1 Tax=Alkalicaulis satelles TaxID=2609175 RepID=A0A5M6ZD25_9PROT|nr:carboxylating nicotinate-nucleotide diphosphorylase [Alkalicaulis satelles]KAA5801727.1 carboxylating nicotinate-nucleotide diphosphorylase [Alkalicaulis satelles]
MIIPPVPRGIVAEIVSLTLDEDLGGRGDLTSLATIPEDARAVFDIAARTDGVLAGVQAADEVFAHVDEHIGVEWFVRDGGELSAGRAAARLSGPARSILTAERAALNFLGRLSGVATLTRRYAAAIAGTGAVIAHTRKTTPALRALEIQAVRAGGGAPHRFGLDDAVLIKDNHVAVCGSAGEAVRRARAFCGHMTRIAVEIDRLDQLAEVLEVGAESVLLDNFTLDDLRQAVNLAKGRVTLEASGGVTLETVRAIAETGIDVISVGALTHSAPVLDLALDAV